MKSHLRACVAIALFPVAMVVLGVRDIARADPRSNSIEGVYELVSQDVRLIKPVSEVYSLSPPRWEGLWLFKAGHFSSVLSKAERKAFSSPNEGNVEFESFAGTYRIRGGEIIFTQRFSLNPLYRGRPLIMKWSRKDPNILILTQFLYPHVEDLSEGTITIVLRKIK